MSTETKWSRRHFFHRLADFPAVLGGVGNVSVEIAASAWGPDLKTWRDKKTTSSALILLPEWPGASCGHAKQPLAGDPVAQIPTGVSASLRKCSEGFLGTLDVGVDEPAEFFEHEEQKIRNDMQESRSHMLQ